MTHAGIIAAGEGVRFQAYAPGVIKPMIPIAGKPLVYWTVSGLRAAGVGTITLLHNFRGTSVCDFLTSEFKDIEWIFHQRDTRNSWESFRMIAEEVANSSPKFIISTVDALISPADISQFLKRFHEAPPSVDAALGATSYVDDEKPLWVDFDRDHRVTAIGESCRARKFATSGLYGLTRSFAKQLKNPGHFEKLREFWTETVEERHVISVPLSRTIDVDRPEDLTAAEAFVDALEACASHK